MVSRLAFFLHIAWVVGVAVLWAGCSGGADTSRPSASPEVEPGRPGVSLSALVDAATNRPPGQDSLAVLDRLSTPLRVETEPRGNRHNPSQIDTLRTFYYRGLQFTVYDVTGDAKEIMQDIAVTDSVYTTEEGVRVGMSQDQVRSALGEPDEVENGTFVYHLSEVTPSQFRVVFEGDRVTRMEWDLYVD